MSTARSERMGSGAFPKHDERTRVLLAADDEVTRRLVHPLLIGEGFDVTHTRTASDTLRLLRAMHQAGRRPFDLVICGVQAYARCDLDVLADVLHIAGGPPVLYVARLADEATRSAARGLGATWVMPLPLRLEDVRGAARYAARAARRVPIAPAESA